MNKILFFTSSHKIGLTGQLAEQAICFAKLNLGNFMFISGEKEQYPGLFEKLNINNVPHAIVAGLDEHADLLRLVREFRNIAKQFHPDIVTVHTNWQLAIVTLARILFGMKYSLVCVIHAYRHNYRFRSVIARFMIGTALYFFADHVIVPSSFLKKQFSFLGRKNKVIFIGEDSSFLEDVPLPSFSGKLRLIFAGEFRIGKNQSLLIRVLKKYIDISGNSNIELYLPGKGPLLDNCRTLACELGIEDKVFFPGFVDRAEILNLYLSSHFAVVPSNVETFGHCIAEPFMLGRVVLTRHVGVADDIIQNHKTGFFFEDETDLLKLLLDIIPDELLCSQVSSNARESKELFRWDNICRRYFDLIYDIPKSP